MTALHREEMNPTPPLAPAEVAGSQRRHQPDPVRARRMAVRISLQTKILFGTILLGATLFGVSRAMQLLHLRSFALEFFIELGAMVAISAVFGIALLTHFARIRRVDQLSRSAIEISHGDLSQPPPFELSTDRFGHDEIDDLALAITHMQENLRELVGHVQRTALSVSKSADDLQQSAEDVGTATDEVALSMRQINQGAGDQNHLVSHASGVIRDMANSIQRASASASEAARAAVDTSEVAKLSGGTASLAGEKIKKVFARIEEASQVVFALDEKIQEISEIVDAITHVAQQTNLLALNATIEAARAGESGRGFSVVAEEVRKLADSSGYSTEQISRLSREIASQAQAVVTAMKDGTDELGGGREDINAIVGALATIADSAREAEGRITSISDLTREQIDGSAQMVQAIEDISKVARANVSSTATVHAVIEEQTQAVARLNGAAQELTNLSIELQVLIQRFKL